MRRFISLWLLLAAVLAAVAVARPARAGEEEDAAKAEGAVRDFEERIEKIAEELTDIRRELESITREMVEGETGRVFIFLRSKVSDWADRSVELVIDDRKVLSRPLTSAELDVLSRDLPLEIFEIRLPEGEHTIQIGGAGETAPAPMPMKVTRATMMSWVAQWESGSVKWKAE
jgi:hypothetical protein